MIAGTSLPVEKTTLSLDETARITTGAMFPDGAAAPLGNVLWLTAEDGWQTPSVPRIDRFGGYPSRVFVFRPCAAPGAGAAGLCFGGGAGLGAAWHSIALDGTAPYVPQWRVRATVEP